MALRQTAILFGALASILGLFARAFGTLALLLERELSVRHGSGPYQLSGGADVLNRTSTSCARPYEDPRQRSTWLDEQHGPNREAEDLIDRGLHVGLIEIREHESRDVHRGRAV